MILRMTRWMAAGLSIALTLGLSGCYADGSSDVRAVLSQDPSAVLPIFVRQVTVALGKM